jgi:N-methylhydantoinase B/acetone carboxylase alpha subunit
MWNPETDMGDIEEWELLEQGAPFLSRHIKPNTAGHGKYRGGSGWETLRVIDESFDVSAYKHVRPGVTNSTSGMHGGYPQAANYSVRVHDTDLDERFEEADYPVSDRLPGDLDEQVDGDVVRTERGVYFPTTFENHDLLYYHMGGGPGYGDPLDRPIEALVEDLEDEVYTPDVVERVYGVVGELDEADREFTVDEEATEQRREAIREERERESRSVESFVEEERERLQDGDLSYPVRWMYSGVFDRDSEWVEAFREFWDLPEDFEIEVE